MSLQSLNQYKGIFADSSATQVVAATIEEAAAIMTNDVTGLEPNLIQVLQKGIQVMVPSNVVNFITTVSPAEAAVGGCIATPQVYAVLDGTEVILSAIAQPGWAFVKWTLDGVDLDDGAVPVPALLPAVTVVEVVPGSPASAVVEYVAVFEVDAP